jgi:transcriptional regulator with XRE-family HTH domain
MSSLLTPGQRINVRLHKLDMTEKQLAESAGINPEHLSLILKGKLIAGADDRMRISCALHVKEKAIWKH